MRYPASEKVAIIRLVEQSHLSVRRTPEQTGVSRPTFCRRYDRHETGGPEETEVSYHELAVRFTDAAGFSYRKQEFTVHAKPTI